MKISIVFMLICIAITTTSASPIFNNWQESADLDSWSNPSFNSGSKYLLGESAKDFFYKKFEFVKNLFRYFGSLIEQFKAYKSKILSARIKKQSERQLREEGLEAAKKAHMRYRREDISKFRTRLNGRSEFLFGKEPFYTKFWFGKKLHKFFSDMRVEYGRYKLRKTIDRLNKQNEKKLREHPTKKTHTMAPTFKYYKDGKFVGFVSFTRRTTTQRIQFDPSYFLNGQSEFPFGKEPFYTKFWFGKKLYKFFFRVRVGYERYKLKKHFDRLYKQSEKKLREHPTKKTHTMAPTFKYYEDGKFVGFVSFTPSTSTGPRQRIQFGKEPFYTKFWFGKKLHKFFSRVRVENERNKLKKSIDRLNKQNEKQLREHPHTMAPTFKYYIDGKLVGFVSFTRRTTTGPYKTAKFYPSSFSTRSNVIHVDFRNNRSRTTTTESSESLDWSN
ncbi:hypothetical protein M8J76_003179 [Diaphorina citri]|nr:hypothetical protein M8J75_001390 [Diaphorina citri]KAI5722063.1 hypothetical protein M8J76_003179 [Diaphorina citri]